MADQPTMYIGPTIAGLGIKTNTIIRSGELPQLKSLIDTKPMFRSLLITTDKLSAARAALKRDGTVESIAFQAMQDLGKTVVKKV